MRTLHFRKVYDASCLEKLVCMYLQDETGEKYIITDLVVEKYEPNKTGQVKALNEFQIKVDEQETKHYAYLKAENEELKKTLTDGGLHNLNLMTEKRVLLQTLTEIKEIVFPKNQLIITDSPIILKIQEKISECEGNDEN